MVCIFLLLQVLFLNWTLNLVYGSTTTDVPGNTSSIATTTTLVTTTLTTAVASNGSLACYDCSESFKSVWEPYTTCQYYPTKAPLRSCLGEEQYCKVEQVSYRELTVSITRGCTDSCYHGCYAFGFGLTRLKCTSCCRYAGCNVGSSASRAKVMDLRMLVGCCAIMLYMITVGWK